MIALAPSAAAARRSITGASRSGVVSMLLALGCSAPGEGADGPPEFSGGLPNAGAIAPGNTAPAGPPTGVGGSGAAPPNGAGGSGSEVVGTGIGVQPAPGQNQSSGQNTGAGGSAMVPPPAPNVGAAGSSMAAGGAGMAPPPSQPQNPLPANPPPVAAGCGTAFFCDDFETVAAGASPTAALWDIIDQYSVQEQSANVQVSRDNAHGGLQALRVVGANSRTGVRGTLPQTRYFVRAWLQIDSAPLGPVFIGLGTDQGSEARLRIQGQSFATINTVGPGDQVHPDAANSGNCADCVTLTPNTWFCAEMFMDDATQNATLWIDGVEAASIVNGAGGWPVQPASPALFLGSMAVQGGNTGVWIDDVAAGPERIGCD